MDFEKLTDEQRAKIAGKSAKKILEFAKTEGHELTEEELEAVAAGWGYIVTCPHCNWDMFVAEHGLITCEHCGTVYNG